MTEIALFLTLLLAHLIADFPLQTNFIAAKKGVSIAVLLFHVAIHSATLWLLFGLAWPLWPVVAGLALSHFTVDQLKTYHAHIGAVRSFMVDQVAHLVCLVVASVLTPLFFPAVIQLLLPITSLIFSLFIGFCLAGMVLRWVWINSLHDDVVRRNFRLFWCRQHLLMIEQSVGQSMICVVCVYCLVA